MGVCRSFWDQTKNGWDGINPSTKLQHFTGLSHVFTVPAYWPRGHKRSKTVCFIKSLNSRPQGLLHHADRLPLLRSSVEPVSPGSLADDAHGWLDLLTVPCTDSKAICLQSPWAHRLCVCICVCTRVCAFNSVNWLPISKAFCVKM